MKTETQFPRTYASSSAAYRAIRQFEEKNGKQGLVMEKIGEGTFRVSKEKTKISIDEFITVNQNVKLKKVTYRHYPDGVKGEGYYELKTGNRRRPNSLFKKTEEVYQELIK